MLLDVSCYRNSRMIQIHVPAVDKFWPDGPLGLYADLTTDYIFRYHSYKKMIS